MYIAGHGLWPGCRLKANSPNRRRGDRLGRLIGRGRCVRLTSLRCRRRPLACACRPADRRHACMHGVNSTAGPRLAAAPPTSCSGAHGWAHRVPQRARRSVSSSGTYSSGESVCTRKSAHAGPCLNRPPRFRRSCSGARGWTRRVPPSASIVTKCEMNYCRQKVTCTVTCRALRYIRVRCPHET